MPFYGTIYSISAIKECFVDQFAKRKPRMYGVFGV